MKWRFRSVKEKRRRFGEEASGRNEGSFFFKKGSGRLFFGQEEEERFLGA
jgi:hypothetical protein